MRTDREYWKLSKHRYAKKVDANQPEIVKQLRKLGMSVELDHDDIIVGHKGLTFWFEIKSLECVSAKTGKVLDSKKKACQIELEQSFKGHYRIVSTLDEILEDMGIK